MLHKCFSIIFGDIFTYFGGIVSGPGTFLEIFCLRRALISTTSALGKSKGIEESKLS